MGKNATEIERIKQQESDLIFDRFTCDDAFEIGRKLIEKARETNVTYAIHITLNRRLLFHFSMDGVSPDNDNWIRRKENVVYRFFKSSRRVSLELEDAGRTLTGYGLNDADYALAGGCFPITLRNAGVVGAITVSGLPSEIDHKYVTEVIADYLAHLSL